MYYMYIRYIKPVKHANYLRIENESLQGAIFGSDKVQMISWSVLLK